MADTRRLAQLLTFCLSFSLFLTACGDDKPPALVGQNNRNNGGNNGNNTTGNNTTGNNGNNGTIGDGGPCSEPTQCVSGVCFLGTCTTATCSDGVQNGNETDIDCGAQGCAKCDNDKKCGENLDCFSDICTGGVCVGSNCGDGVKNGFETDTDCGGLDCDACDDGATCAEEQDCISLSCEETVCIAAVCDDGITNGDETDVDCGGSCDPCPDAAGCAVGTDCENGVCENSICSAPTCTDLTFNGDETDVDCGGPCQPCTDGRGCATDVDCFSQVCNPIDNRCSAPACDDGVFNGVETDIDCGGNCPSLCDPGQNCNLNTECSSEICDQALGTCTQPSCSDGIINGDESDLDCGGTQCVGCLDNLICNSGPDCLSLVCQPFGTGTVSRCTPSQCSDGVINGTETDVDCGGSCNKCPDGSMCGGDGSNCNSGVCNGTCQGAACGDGVKNGTETGIDCGGSCPNTCAAGDGCLFDSDCSSGVCANTICSMSACNDNTLNGAETGVDCGGPACPKCSNGESCNDDLDCTSGICGGAGRDTCAPCRENQRQTVATRCGFENRGNVEQTCQDGAWIDTSCVGVWYASCKEILTDGKSTGDGTYELDPDGPAALYKKFNVFCDMSTDGGGWTEINQCVANRELNGIMIAEEVAPTAKVTSCKPNTQDEGGEHTYHYTFDFPDGFTQFYLNGYQIKANADVGNTSDLGFVQSTWADASSSGGSGDVSFGSGNLVGPVDSYSRHLGQLSSTSCFECVIDWPLGNTIISLPSGSSTKFRMGWGEGGTESEGWFPWWEGTIRLR